MKYLINPAPFILAVLMVLCFSGNVRADQDQCWTELQKGWQISPVPQPDRAADTAGNNTDSIFYVLQNRNLALAGGVITATIVLGQPHAGSQTLYLRTDSMVTASLNGIDLTATGLSTGEYAYQIPGTSWRPTNTLVLRIVHNNRNEDDSIVPVVYLACPDGLERLRQGIISIRSAAMDKGSVDLGGPVFMKKFSVNEYKQFKDDPEDFRLDYKQCAVITVPAPAEHIPGDARDQRIATEFSIDLEAMPPRPLCLYIDTISGPDETYLDGRLIGTTGTAGDKRRLYYDRIRVYPIPDRYCDAGRHRITIVSSKSTEYLQGFIEGNSFRIGHLDTELGNLNFREIIAIAIVAVYITIGLYYGVLFLQRRENREYLFYALSTLSLAIYFFLRSQTKYLLFDNFFVLKRIEYVILFLMLPFMSLFMHYFFKKRGTVTEKLFRGSLYGYLIIAIILALLPVISSEISFWNAILPYVQITWLIPILYVVYLITRETFYYLMRPMVRRRAAEPETPPSQRTTWNRLADAMPARFGAFVRVRPSSFRERALDAGPDGALMIIAVFIMIAAAVHDILLDRDLISGARLSSYGTLFFILGIAGILSIRILKLYRQVGSLNRELNEAVTVSNTRADYLSGIISGIDVASQDLVSVSNDLTAIERNFSALADEQSASSRTMKETFSELTASITAISESAATQKSEGKKTADMIDIFNKTQSGATGMINSVLGSISGISESKRETERIITEMIRKMQVINEGGAAIKNFVEIINDISDRINLLSLNASIEAARAGDHGRGFAVVADEIGKLATATSDNSKEISSQISTILHDINEGMHMVDMTRASTDSIFSVLDDINSRIDQVESLIERQAGAFEDVIHQAEMINSLSGEIAASTVHQMTSMENNTRAVERLSAIADEVAALNRRILSFTETINEKAQELYRLTEKTV